MPSLTNDQVILQEVLAQKKGEVAPDRSESKFFELFAAEQGLKDYDLSWEEIESGIVGSGGDGGIDAIYVFINRELIREDSELSEFRGDIAIELHLFQAKRSPGFSETVVDRFRASTEELLDLARPLDDLRSVYDSQLLDSIEQFRKAHKRYASRMPELFISYYYASLGAEIHPNVERKVRPLREAVHRLFSAAEFSFDFLGARELLELTRKRPRTTYSLQLTDAISTEQNSYVCLVDLDKYYNFISDEEGNYVKALFDANVRDHQGNVQVNRGIRETLHNPQGEDFWWLNNGVTLLASKAVLSGKTLTLENPRVVNGLQTSLEIHRCFEESGETDSTRSLLVRVIVPEATESYERIIKATNSQTSIPIASLRATDRIHRDIEDYFKGKGLFYDRRKNQYKNEGKPISRIVSIAYVAQAVMAIVLGRPDDARARPSTLLKKDRDYRRVFSDEYSPDVFLKSTLIMRRVESYLREVEDELTRKEINNVKFHLAMFASRYLLNSLTPTHQQIDELDVDEVDEDLLSKCFTEVWSVFVSLGADDQVAKGKEFVVQLQEKLRTQTFTGRLTSR